MKPKSDVEITAMRQSGHILASILQILRQETRAGLTPKDMSAIAGVELKKAAAESPFLGFHGYPDIICISVNNQVQHAIPNNVPFKGGDVVNYDFGIKFQGMITDAGVTVCVGNKPSPDVKRLLEGTERALQEGIKTVRAGARVGDISAAVERTLRKYKLGIVRELVGHGVGHELHESPEIPNYGRAGQGPVLRAGMTIAIEPITTLGGHAIFQTRDGWTLLTQDGSWSAQFEHTVLVTTTGCEILTQV